MVTASMLGAIPAPPILPTLSIVKVVVVMGGLIGMHVVMRNRSIEAVMARMRSGTVIAVWTVMLIAIVLMQGGGDAFIYFQF